MKWINEHKRNLRIAFLISLVIAIRGPWFLGRIIVSSPYTCSVPIVRLDDGFCDVPTFITWFFPAIIGVPQIVTGLVTGALSIGDVLDDLFMNYKIKQTIPLMILRPRFHHPIS